MKNKLWQIVNSILLLGVVLFLIISNLESKEKIVFVDNVKVFQEFNMTS